MGGVGGGFATTWEKRTLREDGGGLYVGVREGKDGFPPPSPAFAGAGFTRAGYSWGHGRVTPILTFPPEGGRERGEEEGRFENRLYGAQEGRVRGERWVPAPVFTRAGYSRGQEGGKREV